CKWARELVGTIDLRRFHGPEDFRDELICRLFQAVVGTSRLPLTSLEAPLPAFSLGELLYCYRRGLGETAGAMRSPAELAELLPQPWLATVERAKILETLLRTTPEPEAQARALSPRLRFGLLSQFDATAVLHTLFNEVSLSPYTDLVDRT